MSNKLLIPDRRDLISIIKESTPPVGKIVVFEAKNYGRWIEGICPKWVWNDDLLHNESAKYLFLLLTEIDVEKARSVSSESIES